MVTASLKPPTKPPTGAEAADGAIAELNSLIEAKAAPEPPPPPPPPPKPPRPHGRFLDDGSELLWGDEARSVEELRAARAPR